MEITTKRPGSSNLMAHLCRELNIGHFVNKMVPWDEKQWKVSPGTLITAMVVNILMQRSPLYRVSEFYEGMDVPLLFDEPIQADDLNDDALGRGLDRLAEIDSHRLIHTVACRAARIDNMDIRTVHADTTSISVQGVYESDQELPNDSFAKKYIEIVHGHSKAKRPDLKQFKYGMVVTKDGFPLLADVKSGNQSDGVWNKEILEEFETSFLEYWRVVYVADSALVTTNNVKAMHEKKIKFISLLPGRYALSEQLRNQAWANGNWTPQGPLSPGKKAAHYWTQSMEAEFAGHTYRFIVVRSSNLDKRKEKKLQAQLKRESEEFNKLDKAIKKEEYQCQPDAKNKLEALLASHNMLHGLTGRVVELSKEKRPPGRPPKGAVFEKVTTYKIELAIHEPLEGVLEDWRQKEATFVLITTESDERWDDRTVLSEYKGQSRVEMQFRFMKQPQFVDGIFLKTPKRVEALGYVILLAVMVASFLERRIREALKKEKATILAPGKRVLDRPTATVLFDLLNRITIVYLAHDTHTERYLPDNTSAEILKLLRYAGYDPGIYLDKT